jgi:hypothetical protein
MKASVEGDAGGNGGPYHLGWGGGTSEDLLEGDPGRKK